MFSLQFITLSTKHHLLPHPLIPKTMSSVFLLLLLLLLHHLTPPAVSLCRNFCGNMPIKYPFGIDAGCGSPQFSKTLNCSTDLFFQTPSGNYKVQSIDYQNKNMVIYDPSMSTCSILQPHHDFLMSDLQYALIPPSPDTVFALLNCSIDSPLLNHYKPLCFNFSGHSCDELYSSCSSFRIFHLTANPNTNTTNQLPPPPCCFTKYDTMKYMSMDILDCSHFTSLYNADDLEGIGPLDWLYGMKLSYSVPDTGCGMCEKSGGSCGFDVETEGMLCICSSTVNSTRQCAAGSMTSEDKSSRPSSTLLRIIVVLLSVTIYCTISL